MVRKIIAVFGIAGAIVLNGCAQIKLNCPASGPQMTASVTGPDTVTALTSVIKALVSSGAAVAPFAATQAPSAAPSGGTLTYSTLAFTSTPQTVSCGPAN